MNFLISSLAEHSVYLCIGAQGGEGGGRMSAPWICHWNINFI